MFSGGIEKGHWLHFLMTLKENMAANGLTGKVRISTNSNYTIT